jgi:hypothetical protein
MNTDKAKQAQQALISALNDIGADTKKLSLLMRQAAHESAGFKSRVSSVNNLTGIKWAPKSAIKGEFDSGIKSPEGNNYSAFTDFNAWAKRYVQILNKRTNSPLQAKTVTDFAARLKAHNYYTATLESYTKALLSWGPQIDKLAAPVTVSAVVVLLIILTFLTLTYNG